MISRGRACIAIAITLVSVASFTHAKEGDAPLASALPAEARTEYNRGREAFKRGEFETAERSFRAALKVSDDARLLWNVAACESKRGRFASMIRTLALYEKDRTSTLTSRERDELERAKTAARSRVTFVRMEATPERVDVRIGSTIVATTPIDEPVILDPGSYDVLFSKPGYQDHRSHETLSAGHITWSVHLLPLPRIDSAARPIYIPKTPEHSDVRPLRATGFVTTIAGAVVFVGGTVLFGLAHAKYNSLQGHCGSRCAPDDISSGRTMETTGWIGLSVGTATTLAGALLYAFAPKKEPRREPDLR